MGLAMGLLVAAYVLPSFIQLPSYVTAMMWIVGVILLVVGAAEQVF